MRRLVLLVLLALLLLPNLAAAQTADIPSGGFLVLCYHEVRKDVREYPDPFAVDDGALVAQFAWLRGSGYVPVSLDDIISARRGGKPLPAKAVLLSFDDGYLSFYTRVYPLLREFRFPAVLAVVGGWIDAPQNGPGPYGEKGTVTEASFPTWAQLREMAASGLVEIASHTYDLHRGVPANPQGNLQPAANTRIYDAASRSYEDDAAWRQRVRADLARNAQVIERETGRRPRAIAWPYGAYNDELVRIAAELGSPIALTLGDGVNTTSVPLNAMRRTLVEHNPSLAEFAAEVRGPEYPIPLRAIRVRLDEVYSADLAEQERKLSALLDRIQVLKPTHVYLEAGADTNGDGIADAAYFPNRRLPMRADLFNRVSWQLTTRTDVKLFAVLPPNFDAEVVEDLARHANFDGLLFDGEPAASQPGIAARARAFRAPLAIAPGTVVMLRDPGGDALAAQMRALQLGGKLDFGYGPDDFQRDQPQLGKIAPAVSLRTYPLQGKAAGAAP